MSEPDVTTLSLNDVHRLALTALRRHDCSVEQAAAVADTVTAAERDRCASHGLFRIPGYVEALNLGKVDGFAEPTVEMLAPGSIRVDANRGFAPLALDVGAPPLIEAARTNGVAGLGLVNGFHFAALWPEVELICDAGLVGFAFVGSSSFVAPAGGTRKLFGTNPMAFGWPRSNGNSVIFDQASSASARGEIQLHERDGKEIPLDWAIDDDGQPTTDPTAALAGAQLPFGGHKGSGVALMVELLAGALIGDLFSYETTAADTPGGPAIGGEFMLAISPSRFVPGGDADAQLAHAEGLFAEMLSQEGTRLPSDRRYAARAETPATGATIPTSLFATIEALAGH